MSQYKLGCIIFQSNNKTTHHIPGGHNILINKDKVEALTQRNLCESLTQS